MHSNNYQSANLVHRSMDNLQQNWNPSFHGTTNIPYCRNMVTTSELSSCQWQTSQWSQQSQFHAHHNVQAMAIPSSFQRSCLYQQQPVAYTHINTMHPAYCEQPSMQVVDSDQVRSNNRSSTQNPRVKVTVLRTPNGSFKTIVKSKRKRINFTTEQVNILENIFSKTPYVKREQRQNLSRMLQINDKSIKVWFQNRRTKSKKEAEETGESLSPGSASSGTCYSPNTARLDNHISGVPIYDLVPVPTSSIATPLEEINVQRDNGVVNLDTEVEDDLDSFIREVASIEIPENKMCTREEIPIHEPVSPAGPSVKTQEGNDFQWEPVNPKDSMQMLLDMHDFSLL